MKKRTLSLLAAMLSVGLVAVSAPGFAQQGMISVKSAHDVSTTADRLESVLAEKGMKVFARIDHAAGARSIGEDLTPMELVIFGNPKVGTGLMKCAPASGIDLPMKALIWQDADGATWFGYNDMTYLAERHAMTGCESLVDKVTNALAGFASAATGS